MTFIRNICYVKVLSFLLGGDIMLVAIPERKEECYEY